MSSIINNGLAPSFEEMANDISRILDNMKVIQNLYDTDADPRLIASLFETVYESMELLDSKASGAIEYILVHNQN